MSLNSPSHVGLAALQLDKSAAKIQLFLSICKTLSHLFDGWPTCRSLPPVACAELHHTLRLPAVASRRWGTHCAGGVDASTCRHAPLHLAAAHPDAPPAVGAPRRLAPPEKPAAAPSHAYSPGPHCVTLPSRCLAHPSIYRYRAHARVYVKGVAVGSSSARIASGRLSICCK